MGKYNILYARRKRRNRNGKIMGKFTRH